MAAPFAVPERVLPVLQRLWANGHAAYLVGGAVRDVIRGTPPRPDDIPDVATDARPERLLELFPEGSYQNRFGTVLLPDAEVTTFRQDHRYPDHRRPEAVTFTNDLMQDLVRRDFTVNAIAWGREGDRPDRAAPEPDLVDPTGGLADLAAARLRAVGDPEERFDEDALRLLRGARFASQLGFTVEPGTRAAMARQAGVAAHVSRERVGTELGRLLETEVPSLGLSVMEETGLLRVLFPELAAQRGVAQNKTPGADLWDHTVQTVDAAARISHRESPWDRDAARRLNMAALLHDVGKPTTADAAFRGHEEVGAGMAAELLERLAVGRREAEPIVRLVAQHMFGYRSEWSDAAVRRFLRALGPDRIEDLFRLRRADNLGSGLDESAGGLDELATRVREQLERHVPLDANELVIDGHDLQKELGLRPGPEIGRLLARLLDSVIADPRRNTRAQLIGDARAWTRQDGPAAEPTEDGT